MAPSHGSVTRLRSGWQFDVRIDGKRIRRSGYQTRTDAESAMNDAKRGLVPERYPTAPCVADKAVADSNVFFTKQIKSLRRELRIAQDRLLGAKQLGDLIKHELRGMTQIPIEPPKWVMSQKKSVFHGVPTLFISDVHHGEVVQSTQVNGMNEFSIEESRRRLERVFTKAVYLLDSVLTNADYPGVVLALGGDLVSGLIHEELRETNELPIFPIIMDLVEAMVAGVTLLKSRFKRVYIPAVVGNHGRLDRKPRKKNGPQDNFEYIFLHMLAAKFDGDDAVVVVVPESFDYMYRVYNTRYLLTHGDKFRGGSGISGPILPWTLGEHRQRKQKQAAESWLKRPYVYDTMLMGHWHTYFPAQSFVVNGSVKGFDEYAMSQSLPFEPPKQALFLTSFNRGMSISMPIYAVTPPEKHKSDSEWLTVFGEKKCQK